MTRKKFVKELMSVGESRNWAVMYAKMANDLEIPYIEAYATYIRTAMIALCEKLGVQPKI